MNAGRIDEKTIFKAAFNIPSDEARAEFLTAACQGDPAMLERMRLLLQQSDEDSAFLESPPLPLESVGVSSDVGESVTQIGPYTIREKIGEGGMGVVYAAEQTEPVQRKVAIKIIKPGMDTKEVIARFEAERQALAFMEHPNIARVLDAGATESGRSYFVMELVRGIPITEYCDQAKLPPRERLELFKTVCDAVQHAHQKGIIHRDIKPSNVLVTQVGARPVVKVIDFGLAKAISGQRLTEKTLYTGFMKLMGTPVYMSPEQAGLSGLDVDTRSDVYSLGILLYELLTGTTPLDKTDIQKQAYEELCRQIREVEAPKPSARISTLKDAERSTIAQQRQIEPTSLRQLLRGDLDVVVVKALEKDRERRYGTPQDFAADIDRYLNDQPVMAVPASQLYLARKYVDRHRAAILTAAAVIGLLILATVFSSWQAIRATRYGKESDVAKQQAVAAKNVAEDAKRDVEKTAEQRRHELYVANMQLAAQIWNRPNGNQRQIEELLAAWIPVDGQPDVRDFTWRYQWSLLHQSSRQAILADTNRASFSSDGNLITAGVSGMRVWNKAGMLVGRPYVKDVSNAALSANGHWAVIPTDSEIQLMEVSSGKVVHEMPGERFSLSSNSRYLACWGSEGEIAVWDIQANPPAPIAPLRSTGFAMQPKPGDLLLAPDGKSFLLRGYPMVRYNHEVSVFLDGHSEPVRIHSGNPLGDWAWSPDGKIIASGNQMAEIRLQHVSRPEKIVVFRSHGKRISALAFSHDSQTLVSGGADGTIELWDVAHELNKLASSDTATEPKSSDADNDGTPSADRTYQFVFSTAPPARSLKAHVDPIASLTYSPDGSEIASTDAMGVTKRWSVIDQGRIQLREVTEDRYSGTLGINPVLTEDGVAVGVVHSWGSANGYLTEGDRIVGIAEGANATMKTGDDISNKELYYAVLRGRPGTLVHLEIDRGEDTGHTVLELRRGTRPEIWMWTSRCGFAPDGKSLAVAGCKLGTSILNMDERETNRLPYYSRSVAYSPDGRFLAMDDHFQIAIWDLENDRIHGFVEVPRVGPATEDLGASLAFSPDSKYLAAGTGLPFLHAPRRSNLHVWDIESLTEVEKSSVEAGTSTTPLHENEHILMAVAFTPDGESLIAADHDGMVRFWNTATWSLEKTLEFPRLTAMDISGDGNLLALGFGRSRDPNPGILLWDIKAGTRRRTLLGHRPFAVAFSPDGRTLASTSERHDVLLWDVATGMQLRKLEGHETTVSGADFSSDGTKLATNDLYGGLQIWEAATLDQIDRHPQTLRALYRLGVTQNLEGRYAESEATLRRLLSLQERTLPVNSAEISKTQAELDIAIERQRKQSERAPPD